MMEIAGLIGALFVIVFAAVMLAEVLHLWLYQFKGKETDFSALTEKRLRVAGLTAIITLPFIVGALFLFAPEQFKATLSNKSSQFALDPRVVPILYATNRKARPSGGRPDYSGERADTLSYGTAYVRVPESHHFAEDVKRPWSLNLIVFELKGRENPSEHFVLKDVVELSEADFFTTIAETESSSAIVFVHGYNNSFDDGLYRFAQIIYDGQFFEMVPILFSWPSWGDMFDYRYDESSATLSSKFLAQLLGALPQKTHIKRINIVAHSMGNRITLDAVGMFDRNVGTSPLGEIAFAAPDVDRDVFIDEAPSVIKAAMGATLYASAADRPIGVSGLTARIPRAGDISPDGPVILPGLDSIDVTEMGNDILALNHGTFASSNVIEDLSRLLKTGLRPPSDRTPRIHGVPDRPEKAKYWRYVQ